MSKLTHFDEDGGAHMVDVGDKSESKRVAVASGRIRMKQETADLIRSGSAQKGDVLGVAQVAGIMAAKNTPQVIPMCHPLMLTGIDITFEVMTDAVAITATVKTTGKTGVEMEALTAVSAAALTVYDMVKAVDRGMVIENIQVESKEGGASGEWVREQDRAEWCDDSVCGVPSSGDEQAIDLNAITNLRAPEPSKKTGEE